MFGHIKGFTGGMVEYKSSENPKWSGNRDAWREFSQLLLSFTYKTCPSSAAFSSLNSAVVAFLVLSSLAL